MDGDFKRPLGTNNTGVPAPATTSGFEGSPETYENAEGAPVEAVKEPQEMKEKKPGKFKKFMLRFLLVLAVAGLAAAAGWFWYDGQGAKNDLKSVKTELQTAKSDLASAQTKLDKEESTKPVELTTKEKVQQAASHYACSVVVASVNTCDKATQTIVRLQEVKDGMGFAIVNIVDSTNKVAMHLLLKSTDNSNWSVIFRGDKVDTATIDAFKVPTAYTDLTVSA